MRENQIINFSESLFHMPYDAVASYCAYKCRYVGDVEWGNKEIGDDRDKYYS